MDFHLSGPVGQLLKGDPMEEHRWFHIDFIVSGDTVEPYSEWTLDFLPHQKRDELPMVADVTYTDGLGTHQVQRRIESDT